MSHPILDEVIDLHRFIQEWMRGSLPKTREAFERFSEVLSGDFMIIHPGGTSEDRAQVTASFWSAHGSRDDSFRIEIRNPRYRLSSNHYALATYEEWQFGSTTTARVSTVLFRQRDRNGKPLWVHLHETWLPID